MLGMGILLAAAIAAGPAIDDRPVDEKSVTHVLTGTAAGGAAMVTCLSAFNLKDRANGAGPRLGTLGCYGLTMAASSLTYAYKEFVHDTNTYGGGHIVPKTRRDFFEGVGGTAMGAMLFVPIAEW
jgi:hypothetical protein